MSLGRQRQSRTAGDLADTPVAGRIEPERAGPADDSRGVRLGGRVGPNGAVDAGVAGIQRVGSPRYAVRPGAYQRPHP
jgi:hypothetical protein